MRRVIRVALSAAMLLALSCSSSGGHIPAPPAGTVAVGPATALAFHERAEAFYQSLIRRRFNALETFNDPVLRAYFASIDLFFDYYANLAQDLDDAHFEKSRPHGVQIQEFLFEDRDHARVQVRFVGDDDRPLRPNKTAVVRLDRWVRADETWWVVPDRI